MTLHCISHQYSNVLLSKWLFASCSLLGLCLTHCGQCKHLMAPNIYCFSRVKALLSTGISIATRYVPLSVCFIYKNLANFKDTLFIYYRGVQGISRKSPCLQKFGKIPPVRRSRTPPPPVAERSSAKIFRVFREFSGNFRVF